MADSSVVGNALIDLDAIRAKLNDLNGTITLTYNFSNVLSDLDNIKSKLEELKGPTEIGLTLNPAVKTDLENIANQITNINNAAANAKNQSSKAAKEAKANTNMPLSKMSNRVGLQKYRDEMQKAVNTFARDIGQKGAKLTRSTLMYNPKTKEYRGLVQYENELGKTTKAVLTLDKATGTYRVSSEEVSMNHQAQAKALESANKALADQKKQLKDLEHTAFGPKDTLTGQFEDRVKTALGDYQKALDATKITENDIKAGTAQQKIDDLKARGDAIKTLIADQKELQKQEAQTQKDRQDAYKHDLKANSKQLEYDQKQEAKAKADANAAYLKELKANSKQLEYEDSVKSKALQDIENAKAEVARMQKDAFSGTNALTGVYATEANNKIQEVNNKLTEMQDKAKESFSEASNVSKEGLKNTVKDLGSELNRLQKLEYPSDKLAAKSVDALKSEYGDKITEFRDQLKDAGLESSNFSKRLDDLQTSLQSVGKIDGTGTHFAEWKNQFEQLQGDFKNFGNTIEGQSMALAKSIDTKQLQEVSQLVTTLNNTPQQYQGAGWEALQANLQGISEGYKQIQQELSSGDMDQGKLDNMKQKVADLDNQLKQAASATKIFQDGFLNDQALQNFDIKAQGLTNRFEQLKQRYEDFVNANPSKANSGIEAQIDNIKTKLEGLDPTNIKEIQGLVSNLGRDINSTLNGNMTMSQMLSQNFGAVGQYLSRFTSGMFLITKGVQTVKSMVNEVKGLDTSMMELQKVTNLSGGSLSNFTDQAYKVGEGLGRTGKDVMDAVTTFSRAGYDINESTELAKSALVMSNVGVDIPNMESAASDMISIMKAFDVQASDSMSVIDKLYNVANKEPLDFGNITSMLVTAGGTLAQTNTSLEETMGLLTGGFATLRDNSVANG